jgi:hypothetical protein
MASKSATSDMLEIVPFGFDVEVDKGFLIENECIVRGIGCIDPMKLLEKQS